MADNVELCDQRTAQMFAMYSASGVTLEELRAVPFFRTGTGYNRFCRACLDLRPHSQIEHEKNLREVFGA